MARVTVVGMASCAPGHADDVARAAGEQLRRGRAFVPGRVDAHLFQDEDDPSQFVYVGRWDDRSAFEDFFRDFGQFGEPGWYVGPPTVRFYEPLKEYVRMYVRGEVASLLLIDGPTASALQRREVVLSYGAQLDPVAAGLAEYEVGADVDDPGHLMVFARWVSADAAAVRPARHRDFIPPLEALGARVRRLVGRQRAGTPWETTS